MDLINFESIYLHMYYDSHETGKQLDIYNFDNVINNAVFEYNINHDNIKLNVVDAKKYLQDNEERLKRRYEFIVDIEHCHAEDEVNDYR